MLTLDKKTVSEFEETGVEKLKVFFYEAGCSGTKIDMSTEFELEESIDKLESNYGFDVYVPQTDRKYLENAKITRVVVADHTGEAKARYIFASDEVEDRCWCGTSFAFEKKKPKINLSELKNMKHNFLNNDR